MREEERWRTVEGQGWRDEKRQRTEMKREIRIEGQGIKGGQKRDKERR